MGFRMDTDFLASAVNINVLLHSQEASHAVDASGWAFCTLRSGFNLVFRANKTFPAMKSDDYPWCMFCPSRGRRSV